MGYVGVWCPLQLDYIPFLREGQ